MISKMEECWDSRKELKKAGNRTHRSVGSFLNVTLATISAFFSADLRQTDISAIRNDYDGYHDLTLKPEPAINVALYAHLIKTSCGPRPEIPSKYQRSFWVVLPSDREGRLYRDGILERFCKSGLAAGLKEKICASEVRGWSAQGGGEY